MSNPAHPTGSAITASEGITRDEAAVGRIRALLADCDEASLREDVVSSETQWQGRIFSVERDVVSLPDGSLSEREVVRHRGGCCVVAVRDGRVCLVRQWRVALGRVTLELPAGKLEPGEDPMECARRELSEEAGLECERIEQVALSHSVGGFSDELTRVYRAVGISDGRAQLDPGEFVDVAWADLDDVAAAIRAGVIRDSKTIVGVLAELARRN